MQNATKLHPAQYYHAKIFKHWKQDQNLRYRKRILTINSLSDNTRRTFVSCLTINRIIIFIIVTIIFIIKIFLRWLI